MHERHYAKKLIRKGCTNREVRDLALVALESGVRFKVSKKGIIFYASDGVTTANVHFTQSDYRGVRNLRASLRRMGVLG